VGALLEPAQKAGGVLERVDYALSRCGGGNCNGAQIHAGIDPNADFQQDPQLQSHRRRKLPENSSSLISQKSQNAAFLLRFSLILAYVRS
jgi:hypothetical protein